MWQVSISTNGEGEEAVAGLLERTFFQPPSVFRDEETGAILVTAYPKRLPAPLRRFAPNWPTAWNRCASFGLDPGKTRIAIKPLAAAKLGRIVEAPLQADRNRTASPDQTGLEPAARAPRPAGGHPGPRA